MKKFTSVLFICYLCSGCGIGKYIVEPHEHKAYSTCPIWPSVKHNRAYSKTRHPESCNFVY